MNTLKNLFGALALQFFTVVILALILPVTIAGGLGYYLRFELPEIFYGISDGLGDLSRSINDGTVSL